MKNNKPTIEVELNIFSGRPNPRWELSESQVDELKPKMRMLLPTATPKTTMQLGYRGVVIVNLSKTPDLPELIYAYKGVLTIMDRDMTNYYEDTNNLEEWLLNQARQLGYSKIIDEAFRYIRK